MTRFLLLLITTTLSLGGAAEAARDRQPREPAVCIAPGETETVVYEGRGLAFVPGGGVEPLIVRTIKAKPCVAS